MILQATAFFHPRHQETQARDNTPFVHSFSSIPALISNPFACMWTSMLVSSLVNLTWEQQVVMNKLLVIIHDFFNVLTVENVTALIAKINKVIPAFRIAHRVGDWWSLEINNLALHIARDIFRDGSLPTMIAVYIFHKKFHDQSPKWYVLHCYVWSWETSGKWNSDSIQDCCGQWEHRWDCFLTHYRME